MYICTAESVQNWQCVKFLHYTGIQDVVFLRSA